MIDKNMGITFKLTLAFLLVGLLPMLVAGIINQVQVDHSLAEATRNRLIAVMSIKKIQIQTFFTKLRDDVESIALTPHVRKLYQVMRDLEEKNHGRGAAGVVMESESAEYLALWEEYGSILAQEGAKHGFANVLILDGDHGHTLYSAKRGLAWGGSLASTVLGGGGLNEHWRKVVDTRQPHLQDFSRYGEGRYDLGSFFGVPLLDEGGQVAAVLDVQLPVDSINKIMAERDGLGETGETYLVGSDYLMRSDSRFFKESTILHQEVKTIPVANALRGMTDCQVTKDYRGTDVWSCYSPLGIPGLDWVIVAEIDQEEVNAVTMDLKENLFYLLLIFGVVILFIAMLLARYMVSPIIQLKQAMVRITQGDLDVELQISRRDELGSLADSFTKMVAEFHGVVTRARAVAEGDYSQVVKPRSENDQLRDALNRMIGNLREYWEKSQQETWQQTGRAAINDLMRGEMDEDALAERVLNHLVPYADATMGAFYIMEDDRKLRLITTYAYKARKTLNNVISVGEGVVGQAAKEKKAFHLSNLPEDYIAISSGLGESAPRHLAVVPLLREDDVKGVIELAYLNEITQEHLDFLEQIAQSIAIAIHAAHARKQLEALLVSSQQQAEELEVRQEELRQTNEELEEQTRALQISEDRLRNQQEELEASNQELEERTEDLSEQKEVLGKQNEEIKLARQMIEVKVKELELTNKYKSEFLANISHELRTPLNSMLILSKLLMDNKEATLSQKQLEYSQTINSAGSELLTLINDILDLSKVEAGKIDLNIEGFTLKQFQDELRAKFEPQAIEKGLKLEFTIDPDLPETIQTDGQRVGQIVQNLLSNALKFTEKGAVSLVIRRPSVTQCGRIFDVKLDYQKAVAFSVMDSGIGISEEKQMLVFEAFQQADGTTQRKFGGTGLGLSISRELAKILGGDILLESEEGKGSTFTLILPESTPEQKQESDDTEREVIDDEAPFIKQEVPAAPAASTAVQDEQAAGVECRGLRRSEKANSVDLIHDDRREIEPGDRSILVVEDDMDFARILVDTVREKSFKALVTGDGQDALHLADYYLPSAILLDVGLPGGMDGLAVLARLKEDLRTRHIPVHIVSGLEKESEALRMGALGFLRKPVNMEQLDSAMDRIETLVSRKMRELLLVEDDDVSREHLMELLGDEDLTITAVATGAEARDQFQKKRFDCIVLDLGLPDVSGLELLEELRLDGRKEHVPVIIFTGRDLSPQERVISDKYAERVVIKGVRSYERLVDETTLFLHRLEKDLPQDKRKIVQMLHDKEAIFDGRKVLLVDDDMRNVFALTGVLEDKGIELLVAGDGQECLDTLEKHQDVDLVLMDIMMPVMDGYEAMKRIREQRCFKDLPVIALTAKAMKGDRGKCIEAGASDYLAKPLNTDKLLSMMRVWMYR